MNGCLLPPKEAREKPLLSTVAQALQKCLYSAYDVHQAEQIGSFNKSAYAQKRGIVCGKEQI
ncbi:uncharacterized protein METZ01_LOCUS480569 [marine metagenome]|uniref:Uncharacterized protein n=1 Tax=marine metagenome TaxID=408172 RepID=A0A383C7V5_9ZZZZ